MQFSRLFRSLEPSKLRLEAGEFADEPGYYDGLFEFVGPGITALVSPAGRIAALCSELCADVGLCVSSTEGGFSEVNDDSYSEEKLQGFTTCLACLQLPFIPFAGFKDVGESLDPHFPRMLTTESRSGYRYIAGLNTDGIAIACRFKDNRLISIEIVDIPEKIRCERFRDLPVEDEELQRRRSLERLATSPQSVFFHYMAVIDRETVDWNRGLSPEKSTAQSAVTPPAG